MHTALLRKVELQLLSSDGILCHNSQNMRWLRTNTAKRDLQNVEQALPYGVVLAPLSNRGLSTFNNIELHLYSRRLWTCVSGRDRETPAARIRSVAS